MLEITILIPDELDDVDLFGLLGALRHEVKYADGVGTYSMEAVQSEADDECVHCDHYDYDTGGEYCCVCYRKVITT